MGKMVADGTESQGKPSLIEPWLKDFPTSWLEMIDQFLVNLNLVWCSDDEVGTDNVYHAIICRFPLAWNDESSWGEHVYLHLTYCSSRLGQGGLFFTTFEWVHPLRLLNGFIAGLTPKIDTSNVMHRLSIQYFRGNKIYKLQRYS